MIYIYNLHTVTGPNSTTGGSSSLPISLSVCWYYVAVAVDGVRGKWGYVGVDIGMWVRICVCMYMCVGVTGREENKNNIRIVLDQK